MSDIQLLPAVVEFLARPHGHFIEGQYQAGEAGPSIEVYDPSRGAVISKVAEASEAEVARAVDSARQAFKGAWAEVSPYQKGVVLNRLADLIETHAEELAQLETLCSGKSINQIGRAHV